jgi:hypothetical protein
MEQLTHWRKLRNADYIGEYCMPLDGSEIILTIAKVESKEIASGDRKKQELVIHFQERNWKPMIVNATNAKTIQKIAKSKFVEKWIGVQIQLYVDRNIKAFGEIHEGLRIRTFAPKPTAAPTPDPIIDEQAIKEAIDKLNTCTTEEALTAMFRSFTPQMQKIEAIIKEAKLVKDMIKATEQ